MFLRVRDLVIPVSSITLIDLNSRPMRAGGGSVKIDLGALSDPIEVHGREADGIRELIDDLTIDYCNHDGTPLGANDVVAFRAAAGPDLPLLLRSGRSSA